MRLALVCIHCFSVDWKESKYTGVWNGRKFWQCPRCMPNGTFEGEEE